MRIALLTDGIWPFVIGGMQKHSYYMCKFLARRGVYVDLYHTAPGGPVPDIAQVFSEEELIYIRSFVVPWPTASIRIPGHYLRSSLQYSRSVCSLLQKNGFADLVYAKGLTSWSLFRDRYPGVRDVPVCINVHGYEYFQQAVGVRSRLQQRMLRRPFQFINENADVIYSYGGGITDLIRKHIPARRGRIVEIPAGIEAESIAASAVAPGAILHFIFVGRYERRKGIEEIHQVLQRIGSDKRFDFHFVGDIPGKVKLNQPNVIYHGSITDAKELQDLLRRSDVLVCPSFSEGMPNVIMEGMAAGCAVIASKVGAVDLLVGHDNGWLISANSLEDLETAVRAAVTATPEQMLLKKQRSLQKISPFTWDRVIEETISSFSGIIGDGRHRPASITGFIQ